MALQKIQFKPGVMRDITAYTNEGGWYDCNLVRFRNGFPQSVGGWAKYSLNSFLGICRELISWVNLSSFNYLGVGTNLKFYVETGGAYYDITPIRRTVTLSGAFAASAGSSTITVTDAGHGALVNDFVTFSGATGLGGAITANVLNLNSTDYPDQSTLGYQITSVTTDTYTFTALATATAGDIGTGGSSIEAKYQVNTGLNTQVGGVGWGAGTWGHDAWGSSATTTTGNTLRLWTADTFGQDLLFNVRDGGVYYWAGNNPLSTRAVTLASLSSDASTPTIVTQVLTSDNDRHIIAFGANNYFSSEGTLVATQDPLIIRFSDQENPFLWTPSATNSAGDLRLGYGSKIIRAIETKREILVWTDTALFSMQYLGPPYTFGITTVATNVTAIGFNCFASVDDAVMWMGQGKFYIYAGSTAELLCTVREYVFTNINTDEADKIFAAVNTEFNEITWFYPTADSSENNAYVTYNYAEKAWTYGMLARTAWLDRGVDSYPVATATDGFLYNHELGTSDGSTDPASPINAYLESSPFDLGEGDNFVFIRRVIPDVTFFNSTGTPELTMTLKVQNYPGSNYSTTTDSPVTRSAVIPVEQFTTQVNVRLRGRQATFKVESNTSNTRWSLGSPRVEIQADGRR